MASIKLIVLDEAQSSMDIASTQNTTMAITPQQLVFDQPQITLGSKLSNVSGGVLYTGDGDIVRVTFSVTFNSVNNTRSVQRTWIELNGVEIPRGRMYTYHRMAADGEGSSNKTILLSVNDGDMITISGREENPGDATTWAGQWSNLLVETI